MTTKTEFKEDLKDIKYVVVDANMKRDTTHVIKGLFLGIGPLVENNTVLASASDTYLWLLKGKEIEVLSLEHWDITFIEISSPQRNRSFRGVTQHSMIKRLEEVKEALKNDNKLFENGLIDTSKYVDVPEEMKKTSSYSVGDNSARSNTSSTTTATTATTKKAETTFFARRTKYNITQATAKIHEKMQQLREGTYPLDQVKQVLEELDEGEAKKK